MIQEINNGNTVIDVIKKLFKEHLRVVYDGDGYSQEWQEEAIKRGLPNHKNTVDAISHFLDEKNIYMLSSIGVFTKDEMLSQYEVLLDAYIKTIHVEALTSLKMVKNELYPAIMKHLQNLANTTNQLASLSLDYEFINDDIIEFSHLIKQIKANIRDLEVAVYNFDHSYEYQVNKAIIARDEIVKAMNNLRKSVDMAETKVDAKLWPIPTYIELVLGI